MQSQIMTLSAYCLKTSYANIERISDIYDIAFSLCICLHLIKIIKDLDSSFKHKRPLTQHLQMVNVENVLHDTMVCSFDNVSTFNVMPLEDTANIVREQQWNF